jgi:hypothetical protein
MVSTPLIAPLLRTFSSSCVFISLIVAAFACRSGQKPRIPTISTRLPLGVGYLGFCSGVAATLVIEFGVAAVVVAA